jgi:DNA polymerase I
LRVVIDIEANGLTPTKIWVIVCKDIDTGEVHIFRRVSDDDAEKTRFLLFSKEVTLWIGHNIVVYDLIVLSSLLGLSYPDVGCGTTCDTLIVSRLLDYSRESHSIESYGEEFGLPKIDFNDWSKYSVEQEEYCVRDVEICYRIYCKFSGGRTDRIGNILNGHWDQSISCEQEFELITHDMHHNGFGFDLNKCLKLLTKVTHELGTLDQDLREVYKIKVVPGREVEPRRTKFDTLNRSDFRWVKNGDLTQFNGHPFCRVSYEPYNLSSHKQIIEILNEAGWSPVDKTKTHIETERAARRRDRDQDIDYNAKLSHLSVYGWKVNETNLATLPPKAPKPARLLSNRIILESRRRTLTEWSELVQEGRIHGKFYGIGSWTHRMAHQEPNTANIPNEFDTQGKTKLYGAEMRSLWCAPPGRLLVGVDAEGIQLRIFAHYIDDPEFTHEVSTGDPHSLNQRILGNCCKSRAAAKRFIYALLLGAGLGKLAAVLDTSISETETALDNILQRYPGFAELKRTIIPRDANRGWFYGLDGRAVRILGETAGQRKHLAMSGYLQNGEATVMKHATILWYNRLQKKGIDFKLVDMVHDEWQTECPDDRDIALAIAQEQANAIKEVGERLGVRCPLAGSYTNKELLKKGHPFPYTIAHNWKETH